MSENGRFLVGLVIIFLVANIAYLANSTSFGVKTAPAQAASLSDNFGVVGAIPSLPSDSAKQTGVDKIAEAGFGWMRHEFDINLTSFEHYDAANSKAKAKGIKTLGLLLFTGTDRGHDGWKGYVQNIVSHYSSDIPAWEIMNEADNYLSPSEYTAYLKEAHDIIKGINPNATIVLSGITSRPQTPDFWNGVAAAGGWNYFDVAGLHVYHSGNPEKVNFGGGDTSSEFDRAVAALKKNGGGKKIWITEVGYKVSEVGDTNQANYLARTMILAKANGQIEKVFVYRLYDDNKATYGLLGADLVARPSYGAVQKLISYLGGAGTGVKLYPANQQTLDALESTSGWDTTASSNGSASLTTVGGHSGNGMKIDYNFTADKAYIIARKTITAGQPEAFAAWFYGDDTKNVWKFRYQDSKGETFQTDLGNVASGWNYKQFILEKDSAWVSWDGDGKIDYPVSFNSFVVDRQGGEANANGIVDELVAITGGSDLFAYQFGSTIAYWKVEGTANVELCGAKRDFSPSPAYATGVDCSGAAKVPQTVATKQTVTPKVSQAPAKTAPASLTPIPSPSPTLTPSPSPTPAEVVKKEPFNKRIVYSLLGSLIVLAGVLYLFRSKLAFWTNRRTG